MNPKLKSLIERITKDEKAATSPREKAVLRLAEAVLREEAPAGDDAQKTTLLGALKMLKGGTWPEGFLELFAEMLGMPLDEALAAADGVSMASDEDDEDEDAMRLAAISAGKFELIERDGKKVLDESKYNAATIPFVRLAYANSERLAKLEREAAAATRSSAIATMKGTLEKDCDGLGLKFDEVATALVDVREACDGKVADALIVALRAASVQAKKGAALSTQRGTSDAPAGSAKAEVETRAQQMISDKKATRMSQARLAVLAADAALRERFHAEGNK